MPPGEDEQSKSRSVVSVIIPSYNHGQYLRECIESVIWQSLQDWELVLVDDCSSDDSVEVARKFDDPRIKVFQNEKNLGTYATQNAALDKASGAYVAILNSDDVWLPRKLEMQVAALDQHPECDFCYTGSKLVDDEGRMLDANSEFHGEYPRDEVQQLLPFLLFENRVLASSLMFRTGAVRFTPELQCSGDWVALLQLAMRGPAAYVDEPVTVWRQHPENTYKRLLKVLPEEIAVREALLAKRETWKKYADGLQVDEQLSRCAIALSALLIRAGKVRKGRAAARLAMKLNPRSRRARALYILSVLPGQTARQRLWGDPYVLDLPDSKLEIVF